MDNTRNYPEKMHFAFGELVATEVSRAAEERKLDVDAYIHALYRGEEDPACFVGKSSLKNLYQRFSPLVESTVGSMNLGQAMSEANKAYLCYRLYLHTMKLQRAVMDEAEARKQLITALEQYYQSRGSVFPVHHEMLLLELVDSMRGVDGL